MYINLLVNVSGGAVHSTDDDDFPRIPSPYEHPMHLFSNHSISHRKLCSEYIFVDISNRFVHFADADIGA